MEVLVTKHLNVRLGNPSVNAPCIGYYVPGVHLNVALSMKGDVIEGNDVWYTLEENRFVWSGGLALPALLVPPESNAPFSHPVFSEKAKETNLLGWNITSLSINALWEDSRFGEGIKIAVLDSGIKNDHPEFLTLKKQVWSVGNKNDEASDYVGHGTHCAGIIAAQGINMLGVAPASELLVAKIYQQDSDLTVEHVIEGIEWAAKNGADIISMSIAFSEDFPGLEKLQTTLKKYSDKIIFVAAAGNFGEVEEEVNQYPAAFPECISVGAVNRDRKRYYRSNISRNLTLTAPGENIRSTFISPLYKDLSDTSFATPLVSGVLALMLAFVKQNKIPLSPAAVVDILKHTCDDTDVVGRDYQYGFGIINPVKAFNKIRNYSIA